VTDGNKVAFLRLLKGDPGWQPLEGRSLAQDVRDTVSEFRKVDRAVTARDFESLARAVSIETAEHVIVNVARARCVPRRNLEFDLAPDRSTNKPGHVSVVIVPDKGETPLRPGASLIQKVKDYLEDRRLLTTVVHVVGPHYIKVMVHIKLVLKSDAREIDVKKAAAAALNGYLHPLRGGSDGKGWPFGRSVYVSEIYTLLDELAGVDYVTQQGDGVDELSVESGEEGRLQRNRRNELVAIQLLPDELVDASVSEADILCVVPR
jgi:predicted phage baseplate assembly protein